MTSVNEGGENFRFVSAASARRRKYFEDYVAYLNPVCAEIKRDLPDAKLIAFGSAVRGDWDPLESDIDLLVITQMAPPEDLELAKMRVKWRQKSGGAPIEFHVVDPVTFKSWYEKFIDVKREIDC